jgi:hypothetical protein
MIFVNMYLILIGSARLVYRHCWLFMIDSNCKVLSKFLQYWSWFFRQSFNCCIIQVFRSESLTNCSFWKINLFQCTALIRNGWIRTCFTSSIETHDLTRLRSTHVNDRYKKFIERMIHIAYQKSRRLIIRLISDDYDKIFLWFRINRKRKEKASL